MALPFAEKCVQLPALRCPLPSALYHQQSPLKDALCKPFEIDTEGKCGRHEQRANVRAQSGRKGEEDKTSYVLRNTISSAAPWRNPFDLILARFFVHSFLTRMHAHVRIFVRLFHSLTALFLIVLIKCLFLRRFFMLTFIYESLLCAYVPCCVSYFIYIGLSQRKITRALVPCLGQKVQFCASFMLFLFFIKFASKKGKNIA